ncbi:MAG: metal ABC transporter ATP-binding protein [Cyclobacteriaceae bacterium]|nr:metal ABC transporter ATP-binding protein [Cyclobacteriaceae bacterium]MCH8515240.1 metal ABC transporter ATP-binding protein [Cyclobacteriaceae bacterium]
MKAEEKIALEAHDLSVGYDGKPVLWGIDLQVPVGSLTGVIGPNGAGKSTFIKAIMGLTPTMSGYVRLFNKKLDDVRKQIAYVPQKEAVDWDFPISVTELVMMGRFPHMGWMKRPTKKDREVVEETLEKMKISDLSTKQIGQLSGGQQQRAFIARALAQEASIYLLDEPFAGVDANSEKVIINLLKEQVKEGKTAIVVHHDLNAVNTYFDRLILLNLRLVANGPTDEVFRTDYLKETFGGELSLLAEMSELLRKRDIKQKK